MGACMSTMQPSETREGGANMARRHVDAKPLNVFGIDNDELYIPETSDHIFLKFDRTIAKTTAERQALQDFARNPSGTIQKMFDTLLTARLDQLGPDHASSSKLQLLLKLQQNPLETIQEYTIAALEMYKDQALNEKIFEEIFDEIQAYRRAEICCLLVLKRVDLSPGDKDAVEKNLRLCKYNRSLCHERLFEYEDCISCCREVVHDVNFKFEAIERMGLCHQRQRQFEQSICCWEELVRDKLVSSSKKIEAIVRSAHCFKEMAAREGEQNSDLCLSKAMKRATQAERLLANYPELPPDLAAITQRLKKSIGSLKKLPAEFDYAKGIDSLYSFGAQRGGGVVACRQESSQESKYSYESSSNDHGAGSSCTETPGWIVEAKERAKAAVGATADDRALKRVTMTHADQEIAEIRRAFHVASDLENRIEVALSTDDCTVRTRLDEFSQLKHDSRLQAEEFEMQSASFLQKAREFKENRFQELDRITCERFDSMQMYCQTQLWLQECSRLEEDQSLSTAEIECICDEISVLQKQLEEREQCLQTIKQRREAVQENLDKFKESRMLILQNILEEETTSQELVASCIDRMYDRSECEIFDARDRYNRHKKRIEDLEREARDKYTAWQCDVCAKYAEQLTKADMAMLFSAVGLTEQQQCAVVEQDVDGATFVKVSCDILAKKLDIRSVNHRLLLQHVAESIKNGNLASLFTPLSPDNPMSWEVEQVLLWLQREDLDVLSEAVAREHITGISLMQLNDTCIESLLNVEMPLTKHAAIKSKLQALQASTIGIIQASFSSVRQDIRDSVVAGLVDAIDRGGDPVEVPMPLLCEWTDNFSKSLAIGSGSFGEVFRASVSNSDRSVCRMVAVKRINPALNLSSREQQRSDAITALKREISVLRAFRHPGIIRLLGYSLPAEGLSARSLSSVTNSCLVYELGMRGTLHSLLSNPVTAVQLSWERRLRLVLDIAHALNFMHRQPNAAFHRDLKSSNVVVDESWHAKLIDCGLAKYIPSEEVPGLASLACETNTGQRFGTLAYMCPEYNKGYSAYDQKSEIFSFGIVIGELLTGKLQQPPAVIIERMLHDADQMPADACAGGWPPNCSSALRELALQCMADKAQRTASMYLVVKQLSPLVSEYCPQTALEVSVQSELHSLYRKQQHHEVADLMKQREAAALAKERSQRETAALAKVQFQREAAALAKEQSQREAAELAKERSRRLQRTCCVCGDDEKDATSVITCQNRECNMHFCLECFPNDIRDQCGHEKRSQFVRNRCSIMCCICRRYAFEERDVFAFVDDVTIAIFRQACVDVVELQAYNKAKAEFQSKVEEMHNNLMRVQGAIEQRIYRHRLHICEHILTLKCPRRECGKAILDFTGCFAVTCTCGYSFCGWCMKDCGLDAHPHVMQCSSNPNPDSLRGTLQQFDRTQCEKRRIAVQQYLASLPQEDAVMVLAAIAQDVERLGFSV